MNFLLRSMAGYGASREGPPDLEGMISLKVDNLTFRTTMEEVEEVFQKYGKIGDVYIPRDKETRRSRGFAFVRYYNEEDAEAAVEHLNGKVSRFARAGLSAVLEFLVRGKAKEGSYFTLILSAVAGSGGWSDS